MPFGSFAHLFLCRSGGVAARRRNHGDNFRLAQVLELGRYGNIVYCQYGFKGFEWFAAYNMGLYCDAVVGNDSSWVFANISVQRTVVLGDGYDEVVVPVG